MKCKSIFFPLKLNNNNCFSECHLCRDEAHDKSASSITHHTPEQLMNFSITMNPVVSLCFLTILCRIIVIKLHYPLKKIQHRIHYLSTSGVQYLFRPRDFFYFSFFFFKTGKLLHKKNIVNYSERNVRNIKLFI